MQEAELPEKENKPLAAGGSFSVLFL